MALPLLPASPDLEVTCLDTRGGLAGVAVSPEGRRLVFSGAGASWPGQTGVSVSPLPAYLHWRQFRRLEEVTALRLAQGNAPELLTLARQFQVGQFWYGRLGPEGPAFYELMNLLGDQQRSPRSLERGRPPSALGSVGLAFPPLGAGGLALQLSYQGRLVLVMPPATRLHAGELALPPGARVAALILPGKQDLDALALILHPEIIVIYGSTQGAMASAGGAGGAHRLLTSEGAVSLKISARGVIASQWRP
jgi:hypothetical protein